MDDFTCTRLALSACKFISGKVKKKIFALPADLHFGPSFPDQITQRPWTERLSI